MARASFFFTSTSPTLPVLYLCFRSSTSSLFVLNASWYTNTGLPSTVPGMSARMRLGSVYMILTRASTSFGSSERYMQLSRLFDIFLLPSVPTQQEGSLRSEEHTSELQSQSN